MEILDAAIRGGAIASALILGLMFLKTGGRTPLGVLGFTLGLAIAVFVVCTAPWLEKFSPTWWIASTACHFIPLAFWLFARALFHDIRTIGRQEHYVIWPFSVFVAAHVWSIGTPPTPLSELVENSFRLTGMCLGLFVMYDVVREYRNDLIERRRKIRLLLVGAVGGLFVALVLNNVLTDGARPEGLMGVLINVTLTALSSGILLTLARFRREIAAIPVSHRADPPISDAQPSSTQSRAADDVSQQELTAVIAEMEQHKAYRDESLTIASLAEKIGTQEYRLRRVINQGLGQRNFKHFVNGYRLREVEAALRAPEHEKQPILTLALAAGFNSIGPFNRAFKVKHGITPREFRQRNKHPAASSAETR